MKTLLIVFHSMTGGTRQMAEAAASGASSEPEVRVRLLLAGEARPADLLTADGYLFATPENLGAMSGMMKDFFDRTYYAALNRIAGPSLCYTGLRRQRRRERRQTDRAHRYGVETENGRSAADCLYSRSDSRGDPLSQRRGSLRSRLLRGGGSHRGRGTGPRHFLGRSHAIELGFDMGDKQSGEQKPWV